MPKIDKSVLTFGTPPIIRDRNYLDSLQTARCVISGWPGPCDPAHIRWRLGGGGGMKPSDDRALPIQHRFHEMEPIYGEVGMWRKFMTDELMMEALIALAEKRYRIHRGVWRIDNPT